MRILGALLVAVSMTPAVGADAVHLVGGGKIVGEIVERTALRIVVETGPGRVTLPMSRVTKIEAGRSALSEFRERARSLKPGDSAGWVALGQWADERELGTQAREAYHRALAIDPVNAAANAGIGRALVDGRWLSQEESNRAQGLVPFEGTWVTPAEREDAVRVRSEADLSERAGREAEARVREAEARARAAEAEARRAEVEAAQEPTGDGIPYWPYVYGGGGGSYLPQPEPEPEPRPTSPPPPARKLPTSSVNASPSDKSGSATAPLPARGASGRKH